MLISKYLMLHLFFIFLKCHSLSPVGTVCSHTTLWKHSVLSCKDDCTVKLFDIELTITMDDIISSQHVNYTALYRCTCGECRTMPTERENICCKEITVVCKEKSSMLHNNHYNYNFTNYLEYCTTKLNTYCNIFNRFRIDVESFLWSQGAWRFIPGSSPSAWTHTASKMPWTSTRQTMENWKLRKDLCKCENKISSI